MNAQLLTEYVPQPSKTLDRNILKQLVRALDLSKQAVATFQDPIMAVHADGRVYFANRAARKLLSKLSVPDRLPYLLEQLVHQVLEGGRDHISTTFVDAVSIQVDHQEAFFLPFILRIRDENGFASTSVTVILHDVTKLGRHLVSHP
jgi:nitrogen-specific signal transduction histidine kinase